MAETIPIDKISTEGTQTRAELNNIVIDEYAEAYEQGIELPPIDVYFDERHIGLLMASTVSEQHSKLAVIPSLPMSIQAVSGRLSSMQSAPMRRTACAARTQTAEMLFV